VGENAKIVDINSRSFMELLLAFEKLSPWYSTQTVHISCEKLSNSDKETGQKSRKTSCVTNCVRTVACLISRFLLYVAMCNYTHCKRAYVILHLTYYFRKCITVC